MPLSELKAMLSAEKLDALAAMRASKLSAERAHAMDYYNGDMSRDMPAADGRSRAVSTDVADTIDGSPMMRSPRWSPIRLLLLTDTLRRIQGRRMPVAP
jgi:hypothetical protein